LNTVLVGAGYWGKNFERILQKKSNNLNLKYIVDANLTIDGYECFKDIEELGNVLNDIQCAIVCTPTQTHYKIVDYFLNNNINVLVEKPLATNSKDAQELLDKASKKKLVLLVDHTFLYNSSVKYLKKLIESDELGNIVHLSFERTNLGPIRTDVSCLWDLATHDVSIACALIDDYPKIVSSGGYSIKSSKIYDIVNFSLKYENCFVSVLASWLHPEKSRKIKIVGTKKMVVFDDMNFNEPIKIFDKKIEDLNSKNNNFGSIFSFSIGDVLSPYVELREPLNEVVLDFENRVINNKTDYPLNNEKLALNVISILEEVENSIY
tara:strand:+ start:10590 stop:11555 length:966 start_codon:yes stop_codon:yes gene_type:complete